MITTALHQLRNPVAYGEIDQVNSPPKTNDVTTTQQNEQNLVHTSWGYEMRVIPIGPATKACRGFTHEPIGPWDML